MTETIDVLKAVWRADRQRLIVSALLLGCIVFGMWLNFDEMSTVWATDPTHSHGFLVPLIALAILWMRRDTFPVGADFRPRALWGLLFIAIGACAQLGGMFIHFLWLSHASLLFYIAGVVLLLWGWPVLKWAIPAIGFLVFMIPMPFRLQMLLHEPLKLLSTQLSTLALQTLGFPALREGTLIVMDQTELGVADMCSGLKMLMIFFAMSVAVALLVKRPLWERLIIVASAIPIAVIVNVIRITVTGILYKVASSELAEKVFHDFAGWLMMPLALFFLWIELKLMSSIVVEVESRPGSLAPIFATGGQAASQPPARSR
jgi:exosortase